mmetsp:Transcript_13868/g.39265  ORF Transcript_13868/g.39265 Transcript_13868/m.39265 type:complete len:160 (+) Transcript_13868:96-575(+)
MKGLAGKIFKKKSQSHSDDFAVDTPTSMDSMGTPPLPTKATSFSISRLSQPFGSAEKSSEKKPKSGRGLFGGRKDKGKGSDHGDPYSDPGTLHDELTRKTAELYQLQREMEETKAKAREWKEYSNMQRFKTEVMVDMWVLRMVNGDGKLDTLPMAVNSK